MSQVKVFDLQNKSSTACLFPYTFVNFFPSARFAPCCASALSESDSLEAEVDIWNSATLKRVRKNLAAGIKDSICNECFNLEKQNVISPRMESFVYAPLTIDKEQRLWESESGMMVTGPNTVKIALGNLCNLQCRMCISEYSSRWEKFYINNDKFSRWVQKYDQDAQRYCSTSQSTIEFLSKLKQFFSSHADSLKRLQFIGGEPLIQDEHYQILDSVKERSDKIELEYSSNLMRLGTSSKTIFDYWHEFQWINLTVSIDGIGALNDYIRTGSKFKSIDANIKKIQNTFSNITITSYTTFSLYNIFSFEEIIQYVTDMGILFISNPLTGPEAFSIQNLPKESKKNVSNKIATYLMRLEDKLEPSFTKNHIWQDAEIRNEQVERVRRRLSDLLNFLNAEDHQERLVWFKEFEEIFNSSLKVDKPIFSIVPELKGLC